MRIPQKVLSLKEQRDIDRIMQENIFWGKRKNSMTNEMIKQAIMPFVSDFNITVCSIEFD